MGSLRMEFVPAHRFRVQNRKKGNWPKRAVLLAPHTNEHKAVLPFQSALAAHLQKQGVEVVCKSRSNMMEQLAAVRRKMGGKNDAIANSAVELVLKLHDYSLRLQAIREGLVQRQRQTVVMELHAMSGDAGAGENFYGSEFLHYRRLSGTGFLVAGNVCLGKSTREAIEDYEYSFAELMGGTDSVYHHKIKEEVSQIIQSVAEVLGFDLDKFRKEVDNLVSAIKSHQERVIMVEVPGEEKIMDVNDPNYGIYYYRQMSSEGNVMSRSISSFEDSYAANYLDAVGFNQKDVERVANVFLIK